jgi:hypothetical protein
MAKRSRQIRRPEITESVVETAPAVTNSPIDIIGRKTIDFIKEYAYVYKELRNVIIITVFMFALMIALGFVSF